MIYRAIVERKLRNIFDALNRGDYEPVLGSFGSPVEHTFFGDHALAGSRHGMDSIASWYDRLKTLFPICISTSTRWLSAGCRGARRR